jgi:hypothetical protein
MKIVTSISPNRIERQRHCIDSWKKYGYEIIAIQPPSQVDSARSNFPDITVLESTNTGTSIDKPNHVQIHEHIKLSIEYNDIVLLINSDIEMIYSMKEFRYWEVRDTNIFKIGIRWNQTKYTATLCSVGIDVFQITPTIANSLPNLGFVIGCPHWDYWIVYHLWKLGYDISVIDTMRLLHEVHEDRWSDTDYLNTEKLFTDNYPISPDELGQIIAKLTNRDTSK